MSNKFKVIYNLEGLSQPEIEAYKRAVSEFFGLDADQNWFDALWINDPETGFKKLQLYARRGTTDVLRGQRGINVTSMTQHDGPGYVSFTAVGTDKNGRQEIAVGAHSIEGLKGERLAAAVSTAETRAGRRLTLKFCGLGILDYSEINQEVPIAATAAGVQLDANPVPPAYQPPALPIPSAPVAKIDDSIAQGLAEADEIARAAAAQLAAAKVERDAFRMAVASAEAPEIARAAQKQIEKGIVIEGSNGFKAEVPTTQTVVVDATPNAPKKVRKPRQKKNTVDISLPGQASAPVETPAPSEIPDNQFLGQQDQIDAAWAQVKAKSPVGDIPAVSPNAYTSPAVPVQANPAVPVQALPAVPPQVLSASNPGFSKDLVPPPQAPVQAPPPPVLDFPGKPTKEQEDHYRATLRTYANEILPAAGMVPSEGIGGASAKLRLFAERMSGKPSAQMTAQDWEEFLAFFPGFLSRNTPQNLVKYINDVIGAK